MSFEVRNEEVEKLLKDIGHILKQTIPHGYGFALTIFNYGQGGGMFYISSAERDDMVNMLRELISKIERN